ncbi:hypothetical protein HRbin36_02657 [bacterium HR36]|nr:hypothetical protein HRbin36_02657 [bacterium HR36]
MGPAQPIHLSNAQLVAHRQQYRVITAEACRRGDDGDFRDTRGLCRHRGHQERARIRSVSAGHMNAHTAYWPIPHANFLTFQPPNRIGMKQATLERQDALPHMPHTLQQFRWCLGMSRTQLRFRYPQIVRAQLEFIEEAAEPGDRRQTFFLHLLANAFDTARWRQLLAESSPRQFPLSRGNDLAVQTLRAPPFRQQSLSVGHSSPVKASHVQVHRLLPQFCCELRPRNSTSC